MLALAKLESFGQIVTHRAALADAYRRGLPGCKFQQVAGRQIAYQFMPVGMPAGHPGPREALLASLAAAGVAAGHYFSPHLAEQPYFQRVSEIAELPVTEKLAPRILSLPLADSMTIPEVEMVCATVRAA
ncbi:DegT/DnrJ/EryC1/StrS family aminotransferase [Paeniroseomonas aquatica]|uniref:DegT/DnrJ/EryC1/StrS family aminotransferase n=1 Tax=Paeniroseomonas aquatica TaxID=373043 RepID=UPI0036091E6E